MTFRKQPRQFRISHLVSVSVLALTLGGAAFWSDSDYASTAPALSYAQEDLNARADLRQREGVLSGVTPSLSLLDASAAAREEATASSEELTVEDNVIHEGSPRHLVAEYISRTFRVSMRDARQITDWAVEIGEARDLDPLLILAVIGTESSFKPTARSNAGAEGLMQVMTSVHEAKFDAFGGPDRAHESFTNIQKAINYSMTSFFTTGGIRGGKKKMDKFYPRSFNMGVRQEVYQALGGFSRMRFGEDIDFSIRIFKGGYTCRLFPGAWVYHKRRTDFRKFFKQVHNSGIARINLYKKYPESLKLVHLLPAAFTLGVAIFLLGTPFCPYSLLPIALYALLVCMDSTIRNRSLSIGLYSVAASFIQLIGYGTGFLRAWWNRCILGKDEFEAFKKNFYK